MPFPGDMFDWLAQHIGLLHSFEGGPVPWSDMAIMKGSHFGPDYRVSGKSCQQCRKHIGLGLTTMLCPGELPDEHQSATVLYRGGSFMCFMCKYSYASLSGYKSRQSSCTITW